MVHRHLAQLARPQSPHLARKPGANCGSTRSGRAVPGSSPRLDNAESDPSPDLEGVAPKQLLVPLGTPNAGRNVHSMDDPEGPEGGEEPTLLFTKETFVDKCTPCTAARHKRKTIRRLEGRGSMSIPGEKAVGSGTGLNEVTFLVTGDETPGAPGARGWPPPIGVQRVPVHRFPGSQSHVFGLGGGPPMADAARWPSNHPT